MHRHTDLIEPLSLDEAYLDVSKNKTGLRTATLVARTIREQIRTELQLTASAGVGPNKFLAKIASDWKKPDGLFVTEVLPIDVDLQFAVTRLAKIANTSRLSVYWRTRRSQCSQPRNPGDALVRKYKIIGPAPTIT